MIDERLDTRLGSIDETFKDREAMGYTHKILGTLDELHTLATRRFAILAHDGTAQCCKHRSRIELSVVGHITGHRNTETTQILFHQ